ncbi:MAG TPA: pilus assembly protein [Chloroflexi bacterium]|nr:pilus assembly protein [Chloroflexota bacterium]
MISKSGSKHNKSRGQAIVEFALIISVLLMMMFLIIESGRILWAWNTVQHAAREGARYAITGQYDGPNCAVDFGQAKFVQGAGGRDVCESLRLASIIERTHEQLLALPLNETSTRFEDDYYYNIEVWGVDEQGQLAYDNPGRPGQPVVVRVTYQVAIITPFFRPIRTTIPVFGQETLNNETFGQQSTANTGAALPPVIPEVPTPGVTPSPTPSPTPSNTPTPGPTDTPTATPTNTPNPRCDVRFDQSAIAGNDYVFVTGDIDTTVTIIDLTTGRTLGTAVLQGPTTGHACSGFATVNLNELLQEGHVLAADSSDGSVDTTIVLALPPTNTPTATYTPVPTHTPTSTPTTTPTFTPSNPYITLLPACGTGPDIQFNILGYNWDTDEGIVLQWDGINQLLIQPNTHNGSFSYTWTFSGVADGQHEVRAYSTGTGNEFDEDIKFYEVPCSNVPTPTPEPSATPTLSPADLVMFSPPQLISTRPIVAYEPVQFSVIITNSGQTDVNSQFFVDLYLDPSNIYTDRIPLTESGGYVAVSSLPGGASRVLTITSPLGFQNDPASHQVYGMVDSVQQIAESIETNNISQPATVIDVTPAATPTPSPTPDGSQVIGGVVQVLAGRLLPQYRAVVRIIDPGLPGDGVIGIDQSDFSGFYTFNNIPPAVNPGGYTLTACVYIDNISYFGIRTGITPPNDVVSIYMLPGPCQ